MVGGNTMSEVSINLNVLAAKQQSIVGIPKGSMKQLMELVDLVAEKKVRIQREKKPTVWQFVGVFCIIFFFLMCILHLL